MTSTTNKGYTTPGTGTSSGTWGLILNGNFQTIDNNLGGTLPLSVAGNSDVTLSASQAQNLIYNLTGALTGNINVIFPQQGGFYFVNNQTTGAFTLTLKATGCTGSIVIPQGTQTVVYVDAIGLVFGVLGSTQYNFIGGTVGGTANALTLSQTFPSNFTLNSGTLLTITPPLFNSGSATIAINGGSAIPIQKIGFQGVVNLLPGDIGGFPLIMQYNGSVWIGLNILLEGAISSISTNQAVGINQGFISYVATAPLTITFDQSTTLVYYWRVDINAIGGAVTLAINGSDRLNGGTLGAGLVMPQGSSGTITTDAAGNLYLDGTAVYTPPGATYGANTIIANATTGTATPTGIALSASQLIGRGPSGNIEPVGLGSGLSISTGAILNYSPTKQITIGTSAVMNPYAVNSSVTQAHGLGATPNIVTSYLECLTTEAGYSVGDRIQMPNYMKAAENSGCGLEADATNVTLIAYNGSAPLILNKSTFGQTRITSANWKFVAIPMLVS